jgi:quercetin dioxygenase-like cupin family protein
MAKLAVVKSQEMRTEEGYAVPTLNFVGTATSRHAGPKGSPIWLVSATIDTGSSLHWHDRHNDEVVYVKSGALEVDGKVVPVGAMLIVEANAAIEASAMEPSELLHFGSERTPADEAATEAAPSGAHGFHIIGPRGLYAREEPTHVSRIFADASCPTCDAFILLSSRMEKYRSAAHSHTQDEMIFLLDGSISLGSYHLAPGDSLSVPANVRYRFESGDSGYRFLNFSRAKSGYVLAPGETSGHASAAPMEYTGDGADYAEPLGSH